MSKLVVSVSRPPVSSRWRKLSCSELSRVSRLATDQSMCGNQPLQLPDPSAGCQSAVTPVRLRSMSMTGVGGSGEVVCGGELSWVEVEVWGSLLLIDGAINDSDY